ncbi:MAG: hypothetical protein Q4C81_05210 [Kocuria sp.]|nr:hypothetical protein [Kocuria sp.]
MPTFHDPLADAAEASEAMRVPGPGRPDPRLPSPRTEGEGLELKPVMSLV